MLKVDQQNNLSSLKVEQRANIASLKVDLQNNVSSLKVDQRDNIASLKVDLKSNYRDQLKDKSSRLLTQKDKVIRDLKSEVCLLKQAAMKAEMKCASAESYARECLKQTNRTEDVARSQLLEDNFQLIEHNTAEIERLNCVVKKYKVKEKNLEENYLVLFEEYKVSYVCFTFILLITFNILTVYLCFVSSTDT